MGLRSDIKAGVTNALSMLGDLVEPAVLMQVQMTGYNTDTNAPITSEKKQSVNAVFYAISDSRHALVELVKGDMKMVFVNNGTFTPEMDDVVIRNKDEYSVVGVSIDPANAAYVLQLRLK